MTKPQRNPRSIARSDRKELLAMPCAYCGSPKATRVDHIIPVIQGGTADRENLAPACAFCNHSKWGCTPEQWRDRRILQGLCWPPKSRIQRISDLAGLDEDFAREVERDHPFPADWVIALGVVPARKESA